MAARPVKVAFVADTADLRSDLQKVGNSFDDVAADAKSSGSKIDGALDSTAASADGVASKGAQAAGALTGLGDLIGGKFGAALMTAGVAFQAAADGGDLLNVVTESNIVRKVKDTAVTIAQTAATAAKTAADFAASTAAKVWAGSQAVLNAVMAANPIFLVVAAIALLVGAFVLAYNKSDTFRAIVDKAFTGIKAVVDAVVPVVKDTITGAWDVIKGATETAWGFVRDKIIDPIKNAKNTALGFVGDIKGGITGAWDTVKTKTDEVYDGIKTKITEKFGDIVDYIKGVPAKIAELGTKFKEAGAGVMDKIIEGIKSAASFINDIATTIGNAVKGVVNGIIDKVNSSLEFSIDVGPKTFTINPPDIPHLARGGITTGPTLAVIGDNPSGREAVIPLERSGVLADALRTAMAEFVPAAGGGSSGPLVGAVYQQPGESTDQLAERLWFKLRARA